MNASLDRFLDELHRYPESATVHNPYREPRVLANLRQYLELMLRQEGKRVLLVGEAPGYRGCGITGVPFTSGKVFERFNHPLLTELKDKIYLERVESENTATIVWGYLSASGVSPLFWNSFPFHPHPSANRLQNRAPSVAEVREGITFLQTLARLYRPDTIAGIGAKGTECARLAFPGRAISQLRHPSFGGKNEFIDGMNTLYRTD